MKFFKKIDYQEKKLLSNWPIFREGRLNGGILFEKKDERFRPFSKLGYRTIGSVDENNKGTVGLEYSFNSYLEGIDGKILTHKHGYPQFYTQILFEKGKQEIYIKTVLNDEEGISKISTCKKIEKFDKES